eukprot:2585399-Pyramimonas_sp.AAC.1
MLGMFSGKGKQRWTVHSHFGISICCVGNVAVAMAVAAPPVQPDSILLFAVCFVPGPATQRRLETSCLPCTRARRGTPKGA